MGIWIATHTLAAIDSAICADGGNEFRRRQGLVLPHIGDAYREDDDSYRSHLGASKIGDECERSIYYGWRWAKKNKPRGKKGEDPKRAESRMRRLWNRGHLEEGRFIALLLTAGIAVYQQDADGKQFRISALGGHFGGAGDGVLMGVPDLPPGVPALGEFKTHSDKSFKALQDEGVRSSKRTHYVQMQEYMHHMGLLYALYLAVNKDTDELYAEIVQYDGPTAEQFLDRARRIVFADTPPDRMRGASPGFFHCKYMCDYLEVCYSTVAPDRNCRTCKYAFAMPDGKWQCTNPIEIDAATMAGWEDPIELDKEAQLAGCQNYTLGI